MTPRFRCNETVMKVGLVVHRHEVPRARGADPRLYHVRDQREHLEMTESAQVLPQGDWMAEGEGFELSVSVVKLPDDVRNEQKRRDQEILVCVEVQHIRDNVNSIFINGWAVVVDSRASEFFVTGLENSNLARKSTIETRRWSRRFWLVPTSLFRAQHQLVGDLLGSIRRVTSHRGGSVKLQKEPNHSPTRAICERRFSYSHHESTLPETKLVPDQNQPAILR